MDRLELQKINSAKLVSQLREGPGVVVVVHIQVASHCAMYSVVQSHCSVLSHDTLLHCLSSNIDLDNG